MVAKAQKTPEEGWTMQDGTPWPGNNSRDHPGMIQVYPLFLYVINYIIDNDRHKEKNTV